MKPRIGGREMDAKHTLSRQMSRQRPIRAWHFLADKDGASPSRRPAAGPAGGRGAR